MFYREMSLGLRARGGVCRNCRFWSGHSRCFGQKAKMFPMKLSLRVTFKKENAMYPPSRGQIKPGSCPA